MPELHTFEDLEGLWDVRAVAAFLKLSRSWVHHRAADGTLPCLRIGRNILRFKPAAIRTFVDGEDSSEQYRPRRLTLRRQPSALKDMTSSRSSVEGDARLRETPAPTHARR